MHSHELVQILPQFSNIGVVLTNANGEIVYVNRAIEKIFGHASTELVGKDLSVFLSAASAVDHDAKARSYLKNGQSTGPLNISRLIEAKNALGQCIYVGVEVNRLNLKDGVFGIAFVVDASRQAKIEKAAALYQNISELNREQHAVASLQADGSWLVHEISSGALLNLAPGNRIGNQAWRQMVHANDQARFAQFAGEIFNGRRAQSQMRIKFCGSHDYMWVHASATRVGEIADNLFIWSFRPISEEIDLYLSAQALENILEASDHPFAAFSEKLDLLFTNQAMRQIFESDDPFGKKYRLAILDRLNEYSSLASCKRRLKSEAVGGIAG